jgi:hypothetical protein
VPVGAFALYLRTLAPSLGGTIDSAEFQQAAYSLAIPHPTGYPLYLLVARLWISIIPLGDPAFRVNLLSAVFAALAVWVLYASVLKITRSVIAAAGASLLYAVQAVAWSQAGVAEINSLNTLLTGLALFLLIKWVLGEAPLPLLALVYGTAVSHHRTALIYAPVMLAFALLGPRRGTFSRHHLKTVVLSLLLFALPFAAYVYLPLRAETNPAYPNNWTGFSTWVFGESALPVLEGTLSRLDTLVPRLRFVALGQIFWRPQGWLLAGLGIVGIAGCVAAYLGRRVPVRKLPSRNEGGAWRIMPFAALMYGCVFGLGVVFAAAYDILDVSDYLGVAVFAWCVAAGVGLLVLELGARWAAHRTRSPRMVLTGLTAALLVGVLALAAYTSERNLTRGDLRVDYSSLDRLGYWRELMREAGTIPQNAVLITDWPQANEARYLRAVEGWRPDVSIWIVEDLLARERLGTLSIKGWLDERRPVYLLGYHDAIQSRFASERQGSFWRVAGVLTEREPPPIETYVHQRYGPNIELIGYALRSSGNGYAPGDVLYVTLYWRPASIIDDRLVVFNHLLDESGNKVAQRDGEPQFGERPTSTWKAGETIIDSHAIAIPPEAAPGTYRLIVGLYTRLGEARLPAVTERGGALGDYPELTTIEVR